MAQRVRERGHGHGFTAVVFFTACLWLACSLYGENDAWGHVLRTAALSASVAVLGLMEVRRRAEARALAGRIREVQWSLAALHGRLDTKVLREMERLSDNVDELDDRSLVRLRMSTSSLLRRVREELELRSALNPEHEGAAAPSAE
ncbi:MAG: hypothetical protein QM778_24670 [Myxococcales bacterium]